MLSDEHRRVAADALRTDGLVVLAEVVDPAHLDLLHERMITDLAALQARPDTPYNWNAGNLQQDPPPFPPYLFADVLLNPFVIAVTSALLGPGLKNVMYGGNTALPGDQRQPVHADVGHLWPLDVLDVAHPAAQLVINVATVDVSPANGATELWPGTHRELGVGVGDDIKIDNDAAGGATRGGATLPADHATRQHADPRHPAVARRDAEHHRRTAADARDDPHELVAGRPAHRCASRPAPRPSSTTRC